MPGRIRSVDNKDGVQTFEVVPFQKKPVPKEDCPGPFECPIVDEAGVELNGASQLTGTLPFKSTLGWFRSQFEYWKDQNDPLNVRFFERLSAVAAQTDAAGYMGDNRYTVYNPDLLQSPGNVTIEISTHESLNISEILDWAGAASYPSFYGCGEPVWIWEGTYGYDRYGNLIEEMPATSEQQQIKQVFETAVGPEYLYRVRAPGYGLARKWIPLAVSGLLRLIYPGKTVNDIFECVEYNLSTRNAKSCTN